MVWVDLKNKFVTSYMKAHAQTKNMQMKGAPGRPSLAVNMFT